MIQKTMLIHVVLAILLVGCNGTDKQKTEAIKPATETTAADNNKERRLPRTVEEAVALIIKDMSEKDKQTLRSKKKDELIMYHLGWGTGIRNSFGLWGGNRALMKDTGADHPDDASMVIIEAVWEKLQNTK